MKLAKASTSETLDDIDQQILDALYALEGPFYSNGQGEVRYCKHICRKCYKKKSSADAECDTCGPLSPIKKTPAPAVPAPPAQPITPAPAEPTVPAPPITPAPAEPTVPAPPTSTPAPDVVVFSRPVTRHSRVESPVPVLKIKKPPNSRKMGDESGSESDASTVLFGKSKMRTAMPKINVEGVHPLHNQVQKVGKWLKGSLYNGVRSADTVSNESCSKVIENMPFFKVPTAPNGNKIFKSKNLVYDMPEPANDNMKEDSAVISPYRFVGSQPTPEKNFKTKKMMTKTRDKDKPNESSIKKKLPMLLPKKFHGAIPSDTSDAALNTKYNEIKTSNNKIEKNLDHEGNEYPLFQSLSREKFIDDTSSQDSDSYFKPMPPKQRRPVKNANGPIPSVKASKRKGKKVEEATLSKTLTRNIVGKISAKQSNTLPVTTVINDLDDDLLTKDQFSPATKSNTSKSSTTPTTNNSPGWSRIEKIDKSLKVKKHTLKSLNISGGASAPTKRSSLDETFPTVKNSDTAVDSVGSFHNEITTLPQGEQTTLNHSSNSSNGEFLGFDEHVGSPHSELGERAVDQNILRNVVSEMGRTIPFIDISMDPEEIEVKLEKTVKDSQMVWVVKILDPVPKLMKHVGQNLQVNALPADTRDEKKRARSHPPTVLQPITLQRKRLSLDSNTAISSKRFPFDDECDEHTSSLAKPDASVVKPPPLAIPSKFLTKEVNSAVKSIPSVTSVDLNKLQEWRNESPLFSITPGRVNLCNDQRNASHFVSKLDALTDKSPSSLTPTEVGTLEGQSNKHTSIFTKPDAKSVVKSLPSSTPNNVYIQNPVVELVKPSGTDNKPLPSSTQNNDIVRPPLFFPKPVVKHLSYVPNMVNIPDKRHLTPLFSNPTDTSSTTSIIKSMHQEMELVGDAPRLSPWDHRFNSPVVSVDDDVDLPELSSENFVWEDIRIVFQGTKKFISNSGNVPVIKRINCTHDILPGDKYIKIDVLSLKQTNASEIDDETAERDCEMMFGEVENEPEPSGHERRASQNSIVCLPHRNDSETSQHRANPSPHVAAPVAIEATQLLAHPTDAECNDSSTQFNIDSLQDTLGNAPSTKQTVLYDEEDGNDEEQEIVLISSQSSDSSTQDFPDSFDIYIGNDAQIICSNSEDLPIQPTQHLPAKASLKRQLFLENSVQQMDNFIPTLSDPQADKSLAKKPKKKPMRFKRIKSPSDSSSSELESIGSTFKKLKEDFLVGDEQREVSNVIPKPSENLFTSTESNDVAASAKSANGRIQSQKFTNNLSQTSIKSFLNIKDSQVKKNGIVSVTNVSKQIQASTSSHNKSSLSCTSTQFSQRSEHRVQATSNERIRIQDPGCDGRSNLIANNLDDMDQESQLSLSVSRKKRKHGSSDIYSDETLVNPFLKSYNDNNLSQQLSSPIMDFTPDQCRPSLEERHNSSAASGRANNRTPGPEKRNAECEDRHNYSGASRKANNHPPGPEKGNAEHEDRHNSSAASGKVSNHTPGREKGDVLFEDWHNSDDASDKENNLTSGQVMMNVGEESEDDESDDVLDPTPVKNIVKSSRITKEQSPAIESRRQEQTTPSRPLKPMCFISSCLDPTQKSELAELATLCGGVVSEVVSDSVTHLVIADENGFAPSTYKCLCAIAMGKWIVSINWVTECLNRMELVNEEEYELKDADTEGYGPRISRLSTTRLFQDFTFCLVEPPDDISDPQLENLLGYTGATVISLKSIYCRAPFGKKYCVALSNGLQNKDSRIYQMFASRGIVVVNYNWLYESIKKYNLTSIWKHLPDGLELYDKRDDLQKRYPPAMLLKLDEEDSDYE